MFKCTLNFSCLIILLCKQPFTETCMRYWTALFLSQYVIMLFTQPCLHFSSTRYCTSARAIPQILASSPRAAGLRASANIMTYSPRMNVITSLLHDHQCQFIILALWSVPYIIYWHSGTFELVGYHATSLLVCQSPKACIWFPTLRYKSELKYDHLSACGKTFVSHSIHKTP